VSLSCARPRTLLLVAAVASVLGACRDPVPRAPWRRVLVIALDGMDHRLVSEMLARGDLPTFARLARTGGFAPLETTIPPQSPTAWATFITGQTPGRHGIFDFLHRDPRTLTPYLSTTHVVPGRRLALGRRSLPLTADHVTLLRREKPFWSALDHAGVPATVVKIPAHYPPTGDGAARVLAGMGVPDLLGTYGTFTVLTTDRRLQKQPLSGGRVSGLRRRGADHVYGTLEGPPDPTSSEGSPLTLPVELDLDDQRQGVYLSLGSSRLVLEPGEWSPFVPLEFSLPCSSIRGMARVYLQSIDPELTLYLSPINVDPEDPALPIDSPPGFARELSRRVGRFETLGIPEDTKALAAGVLTPREFLEQARQVLQQRELLLEALLDEFERGFLFFYFSSTDQLAHIFYRAQDPSHPARTADDVYFAQVLAQTYRRMDQTVARALRRLGPGDLLLVMSDHGFGSVGQLFDLNAWLRQEGYLALRDSPSRESLGHIDWARTQAYGLGLNGLYLNLAGRERHGVVPLARRDELLSRLADELLSLVHPETGQRAVTEVVRPDRVYPGPALGTAPDLIVGYGPGFKVDEGSALGTVGPHVFKVNRHAWGGDHCGDHRLVPGVLLSNAKLRAGPFALHDLAPTILQAFGVPQDGMTGRPIFPSGGD
jgi:predicted AlkP superfamily phosphohydrolase/phosphomutase